MKSLILTVCMLWCVYESQAQFDAAFPHHRAPIPGAAPAPRPLQIPGAIPLGPVRGGATRGRVLQQGARRPAPPNGFYRANPTPNIPPPFSAPISKPVTEDPDEDNYPSNANLDENIDEQIAQKHALLAQLPALEGLGPIPQANPAPIAPVQFRPESRPQIQQLRPQPARIPQPIHQEPAFRPIQQQQPVVQQRVRPAPRPAPQQLVPQQRNFESQGRREKEKKPVAQILRKYNDQNADGSITWGYENDDGSFKEETIGVDCITRGKYGYVDPDGVRREYNYETGLPCDTVPQEEEYTPPAVNHQPRRPRPQ